MKENKKYFFTAIYIQGMVCYGAKYSYEYIVIDIKSTIPEDCRPLNPLGQRLFSSLLLP